MNLRLGQRRCNEPQHTMGRDWQNMNFPVNMQLCSLEPFTASCLPGLTQGPMDQAS